jgi:hypothetical protein
MRANMFLHHVTVSLSRRWFVVVFSVAGLIAGCARWAPATSSPASPFGAGPGVDESGQVTDSKKVRPGYGRVVTAENGTEGEITGLPAAGSAFARLRIGMSAHEALQLLGTPTDQGAHVNTWGTLPGLSSTLPYRQVLVYKNQGRLVFASSQGFDAHTSRLVWIIHSAAEQGPR